MDIGGINDPVTAALVLTPIVTGAVEAIKRIPRVALTSWLLPFLAVAAGVAISFVWAPELPWRDEVQAGAMSGLAAAGLFSGIKTIAGK